MQIQLDGYQMVQAAQDYIKKVYGVDMNVGADSIEVWANIYHLRTEYKRNKDGTLKRNNKGELIVDKEKSKPIEATYPAQESVTMEFHMTPLRLLEEEDS